MITSILGGGSGGYAMAADLALKGFEVRLYEVPEFTTSIAPLIEDGKIEVTGLARKGTAKISKVTTDIGEAIEGSHVINIVAPAFAHQKFYTRLSKHIEDGQIIITHNGYFGALQLMHTLDTMEISKEAIISETSILIYGCRKIDATKVHVNSVKSTCPLSALPCRNTKKVLEAVKDIFPQFVMATNVLETSLENLNVILHPPVMLLNAARVEDIQEEFLFYSNGASPSVCRIMEQLDGERIAVEKALGLKPTSTKDWLNKMYGSSGKNLYERIQDTPAYSDPVGGKAPSNLQFRYITEDVPYGLVPLVSLGDLLKVPTPTAKALITLCSTLNNTDYWSKGITVNEMGFAGKTAEQIKNFM